jgi:hypothetical protein
MKLLDILKEQELSYSPDKLQEYIKKCTNNIAIAKREYNKCLIMVKSLSINDVIDGEGKYEGMLSQMESIKTALRKKYDEYWGVIDSYPTQDAPDGVWQLEKLTTDLEECEYNISDLNEILGNIIESSKKLPKEEVTTIQTNG